MFWHINICRVCCARCDFVNLSTLRASIMDFKKSKRLLIWMAVIYWIFAIGIYAISYQQFRYSPVSGEKLVADSIVGEILDGQEFRQTLIAPCDVIDHVEIMTGNYDRDNTGSFMFTVMDSEGAVLAEQAVPVAHFTNNAYSAIPFAEPIEAGAGETITFVITPQGCTSDDTITIYVAGSMVTEKSSANHLLNGEESRGTLCIQMNGYNNLTFYITYIVIVVVAFVLMAIYAAWCWKNALRGKSNPLVTVCTVYSRYSFLIKQLVSRDFKTKYKRSTLGMAWSVMNPLLTMSVQYVVFSTLFKSNIPYYPVYLLTGIVFFSFFNEAVSMGMTSIIGNAPLIKKVYMPKYIYPISRIISSLVNFGLALLPLLLVILITRVPVKASILLLIFDIACFLIFIIGITLLLAAATTFFQDIQFLWGVLCMIWQYLTPIFYPETIIDPKFLPIYRLNPLYQYVTFARTCIIDGISPEPKAYFLCLFFAAAMLAIGARVFKKHQDEFVFHL